MPIQIITAEPVKPPSEIQSMTFAEAQAAVGGYFEVVWLAWGSACLLVNKEGRLKALPVNALATALAGRVLVGDVVHLTDTDAVFEVLGG